MNTQSIETIAGIAIPDTPLVREVTDYIRATEDDLLFDHSRRVFLFGALQGAGGACSPTSSCCTWGRCSTTSA